ncbi:hypothetical protein PTI98_001625 [Pleurotus ostreatus]|nr:hypothetical protein PTI98_001625 [Pleurotus ostreatus]
MKDHHFRPRQTSASHQPCSTERMVNPWYFTQLRLPVYKHGYMRRFHPYPCSKRRRDETDPWMDGFLQESTIRPTDNTNYEDENEESDARQEKGTIFLLVVDNLNVSAERILMSGRKM